MLALSRPKSRELEIRVWVKLTAADGDPERSGDSCAGQNARAADEAANGE